MKRLLIPLLLGAAVAVAAPPAPQQVLLQWGLGGQPPSDAPDHWWYFDESGGTTVTDYGEAAVKIDGALVGGLPLSSQTFLPARDWGGRWVGALEQVAAITGGSGTTYTRVELGSNPSIEGKDKVTLTIRLNSSSTGNKPSDGRFFSQSSNWGEQDHLFMIGLTSTTTVRARIGHNGGTTTYVTTVSVPEDVDVFLCAVIDFDLGTNDFKIYKDGNTTPDWQTTMAGNEIDGAHISGSIRTGMAGQPAADPNWGSPFNGEISDVRLWLDKALTGAECNEVYNNVY